MTILKKIILKNDDWGWSGKPKSEKPQEKNNQKNIKEELLGKFFNKNNGQNNPEISIKYILLFVLIIIGIWVVTGFYRVNPDEKGVELVFGKLDKITSSGLQYNYPYPVGKTYVESVQKVRRTDVGYRSSSNSRFKNNLNETIDVPDESLVLTSDENIVDIDFTVFWKISDIESYLFNIRNPEYTVKIAAESVIREVIGKNLFDDAVTTGRQEIESDAKIALQKALDTYNSGIEIEEVEMQKSDPPSEVIDAFNDVQRARQDRDRLRNEAQAYANSVVPEARGEAERIVKEAEGYKQKLINESEGEAERFNKVYAEYRKSPEVIRKRIYLDTLAEIYTNTDKIIIDDEIKGILPYLKLPSSKKNTNK